jgi:hypothetical protein
MGVLGLEEELEEEPVVVVLEVPLVKAAEELEGCFVVVNEDYQLHLLEVVEQLVVLHL